MQLERMSALEERRTSPPGTDTPCALQAPDASARMRPRSLRRKARGVA